ncbi:MAG: hypothetical protein JWL60_304, partial [Gemmatimonadetes bacterium]|nr:hypothetical protein [Gemmatimonadota bacterium]
MSYAGPANRSRASTGTASPLTGSREPAAARSISPRNHSGVTLSRQPVDEPGTDWQQVAIFGAGLALGIAVGAGAALLTAPRTGAETRASLRAGASRVRRTTSR